MYRFIARYRNRQGLVHDIGLDQYRLDLGSTPVTALKYIGLGHAVDTPINPYFVTVTG